MPGHRPVSAIKRISDDPVRVERRLKMRNASRIAQEFYRIRRAKGYSQKRAAELLRCSVNAISRLEDGDYTCAEDSLKLLQRMAFALKCDYHVELLGE